MKALLVACLVAVLYVDIANSLMCYTCTNQTSNDQCLSASPCTKNETGCLTTVVKIGSGAQERKLISKKCVSNCDMFRNFYECCRQDNCNRNKASGMRPSIAVLGTAVLVIITKPLLWTGL